MTLDNVLSFLKDNGPAIGNWFLWILGATVTILTAVKTFRQGPTQSAADLWASLWNAFKSLPKPPTSLKLLPFGLAGLLVFGCASPYQKMLDTIQGATVETIKETAKNGLGQYQAGAQVINPGYDVEVGILARCSVKMTGVAGQIQSSGQGSRTPMTTQEAETANHVIRDTSIANQDKRDMLKGVGRAIASGASAINEDVRDAAGLNNQALTDQSILVMCYRIMLSRELSSENKRATVWSFALAASPETKREIQTALNQVIGEEVVVPPSPTTAPAQ